MNSVQLCTADIQLIFVMQISRTVLTPRVQSFDQF